MLQVSDCTPLIERFGPRIRQPLLLLLQVSDCTPFYTLANLQNDDTLAAERTGEPPSPGAGDGTGIDDCLHRFHGGDLGNFLVPGIGLDTVKILHIN